MSIRLIALLALPFAAPALAAPPPVVQAVQAAAGLSVPEADTIRFTAIEPGGRGATIYQAGRDGQGSRRTLIDLSPGAGGGWSVLSRETQPLAAETFDYMKGRIDTALAAESADGACDQATYHAEHGAKAASGCGPDAPVAAVARALGLADPVAP